MAWTRQLAGLAAGVLALVALYWQTMADLVRVWSSGESHHFLFLVLPISLYLIWLRREEVAPLEPRLRLWALIPLLAFAGLWLVSDAAFVGLGKHVALVGMLLSLTLLFLGETVFRSLLFPLLLLWLMVPVGDQMMPQMIDLTAALSKAGFWLAGERITTDGSILITNEGRYAIVEECSSLPFIIGNLLITLVYANLVFTRPLKRFLFVAASVPVALLANVVRIVSVVRVTELSGGEMNLVADHALYGWIIFAVFVALELFIGHWFADPATARPALPPHAPVFNLRASRRRILATTVGVVVAALAAPHLWALAVPPIAAAAPGADICAQGRPLAGPSSVDDWQPVYPAADHLVTETVAVPGKTVDVVLAYYSLQEKGRELIGWPNRSYDEKTWAFLESLDAPDLANMPPPRVERLRGPDADRRIVWTWYWVDGRLTGDPAVAKMRQAWAALAGHDAGAAALLLSVREEFAPESAEPALRVALDDLGDIRRLMARAACPPAGL